LMLDGATMLNSLMDSCKFVGSFGNFSVLNHVL
jgi:hypothetical protein